MRELKMVVCPCCHRPSRFVSGTVIEGVQPGTFIIVLHRTVDESHLLDPFDGEGKTRANEQQFIRKTGAQLIDEMRRRQPQSRVQPVITGPEIFSRLAHPRRRVQSGHRPYRAPMARPRR